MRKRSGSKNAFTLLEMSIVLAIIAIVTASGVTLFSSQLQKRQLQETQFKMQAIQQALLNYRIAYNRLPCPADVTIATQNANYALEASNPGDCYNLGTIKANFVGSGVATGNVASFVKTDTTTSGNWSGNYGADGYAIANGSPWTSYPAYATVSYPSATAGTWADPVVYTSTQALQRPGSISTQRTAGYWYNVTNFTIDVNLTDGLTHQVSLYALDWDSLGPRSETIQVEDGGNGTVLDGPRTLAQSTFINPGKWMVWSIKGHVKFVVTDLTGNAVISGVFFDTVASSNIYPIEGMVPVRTLRLPDDYAFDAWGRRILYAVDSDMTATGAFLTIPVGDNTTRMTVYDASDVSTLTTKAGYVLLSTGPSGHGGYGRNSGTTNASLTTSRINAGSNNADEQNNCDCSSNGAATGLDGIFVQKQYTVTAGHETDRSYDFDDILMFGTRSDLRTPQE